MGAVGASAPTVFESVGASTHVFYRFLTFASIFKEMMRNIFQNTVLALFEPHSWIEPHPLNAKMQFSCVLKNRTPGFK